MALFDIKLYINNNIKSYYYKNFTKISIIFFLFFIILQFNFSKNINYIKPDLKSLPDIISKRKASILSFGDKQLFFRNKAIDIQHAGDYFGISRKMTEYNYKKLYDWFKLLDYLDNRSILVPTFASKYYIITERKEDNYHIMKYLVEFSIKDVDKYYLFLYSAMMIAKYDLKDTDLAIDISYKLATTSDKAPLWTKRAPVLFLPQVGKNCEAYIIVHEILEDAKINKKDISPEELDFMNFLIDHKILDEGRANLDIDKCLKEYNAISSSK